MTIDWTCLTNYIGVGYGYSTHQKRLLEAIQRQGVKIDTSAKIAVHLTTVDSYKPIPGKYNVLYSMYECVDLPKTWIEPLETADLIVVPCRQNQFLFKRYTKKPVEVCWEGVEIDKFTYIKREYPKDRPFTFMWLGASNPRKGTEHVMAAWELWCKYWLNQKRIDVVQNTRLVMKTTQESDRMCGMEFEVKYNDGEPILKKKVSDKLPAERIVAFRPYFKGLEMIQKYSEARWNAIIDTRRLPILPEGKPDFNNPNSLQEIYHSSHCFLLPTRGEGFGLTLAEAASTGLPCVYTPWGGTADFMSKKIGYPLKFTFAPVKTIAWKKGTGEKYISHTTRGASADINHLFRRMLQIYSDYDTALEKGKKASKHIRQGFTWDISARSFLDIIQRYTGEAWKKTA
jgi:glycosyltransferase involved in cell wall biosynthesis